VERAPKVVSGAAKRPFSRPRNKGKKSFKRGGGKKPGLRKHFFWNRKRKEKIKVGRSFEGKKKKKFV